MVIRPAQVRSEEEARVLRNRFHHRAMLLNGVMKMLEPTDAKKSHDIIRLAKAGIKHLDYCIFIQDCITRGNFDDMQYIWDDVELRKRINQLDEAQIEKDIDKDIGFLASSC